VTLEALGIESEAPAVRQPQSELGATMNAFSGEVAQIADPPNFGADYRSKSLRSLPPQAATGFSASQPVAPLDQDRRRRP
jgi:hypothetical protein